MRSLLSFSLLLMALLVAPAAEAFTATIAAGTRAMYLRVGTGSFTGAYNTGGTMQNNTTIDDVAVTIPAISVGNGTAFAMSSTSSQGISHYDNFNFCPAAPTQVYIGGFFRRPSNGGNAILSVTSPANLVNDAGDTIPFTQISWATAGANETPAEQPIAAGTFSGGTQTLATFPANSWRESCHSFSYANGAIVPPGVYNGRVTYTLSAP